MEGNSEYSAVQLFCCPCLYPKASRLISENSEIEKRRWQNCNCRQNRIKKKTNPCDLLKIQKRKIIFTPEIRKSKVLNWGSPWLDFLFKWWNYKHVWKWLKSKTKSLIPHAAPKCRQGNTKRIWWNQPAICSIGQKISPSTRSRNFPESSRGECRINTGINSNAPSPLDFLHHPLPMDPLIHKT
jgi:hypothetical protein